MSVTDKPILVTVCLDCGRVLNVRGRARRALVIHGPVGKRCAASGTRRWTTKWAILESYTTRQKMVRTRWRLVEQAAA